MYMSMCHHNRPIAYDTISVFYCQLQRRNSLFPTQLELRCNMRRRTVSTGNFGARSFLRKDVLRQGEFNMVASWEGIGKTAFKLLRKSGIVGPVYVIIGEYASVEYYSVALLQRVKYREEECLRDYVHPHGGVSSTPVQQSNNITVN